MKTDTPRTDSFCIELEPTDFDCNCWSQVVAIANFSRQLERELEQAKRDNGIIITAFALRNSELKEKAEAEVASISEELAKAMSMIDRDMECEKEVARLRDLLKEAINIADESWDAEGYVPREFKDRLQSIKDELARLANAQEEPENDWKCPHCGSTTGTWFSRVEPMGDICEDCGKAVDEEPAPEWRELGPDEVICEGDQVQPKHHDRKGAWIWIWSHEIGATPRDQEAMRYRTRRPLLKPILSRDSYDEDWNLKQKQEEMPLEDEIETIWEHSEQIDSITGHMAFKALAKSIRYFCDEIQKLKTQTHYHHESYCRKCKEPK
jgi:hypothetical protein